MRILITKQPLIILVMLLGFVLSGCADKKSGVICFEPVEPFEPNSGAELLEEFNSHLSFNVSPKNFICKYKNDKLVGWVIVRKIDQKDIVKQKLKQSSTLKLLQVELLESEFKAVFKKEWRQSQTVAPPQK